MANLPDEDERAELIARVGNDVIMEYWKELIYDSEAYAVMPDFCTVENAQFWLDVDVFKRWFAARAQRQLMASLEPPQRGRSWTSQASSRGSSVALSARSRSPSVTSVAYSSDVAIPPYSSCASSRSSSIVSSPCPSRSPSPDLSHDPKSAAKHPLQYYYDTPPTRGQSSEVEPRLDTFAREDKVAPLPSCAQKGKGRATTKRPRSPSVSSDTSVNADATPLPASQPQGKTGASARRPKKVAKQGDGQMAQKILITSAKWVHKLVTLTSLPETCWTIPQSADGTMTAYLLDLSGDDPDKWTKDDGLPMSMAAIIKSEDQDAWGGGSSGSLQKASTVVALGDGTPDSGVKCQLADHRCQGVFHCPYIRPSLLENCQRYGPDEAEVEQVAVLQRQQNSAQTSSEATEAVTFYNVAVNTKCSFKHHDGTLCQGRAVLRALKTVSFNGKHYFVGCENWQWYHENKGRGHRNMHIPARVLETLVVELFRNGGVLDRPEQHQAAAALEGRVCTVIEPPRVGSKGSGKCKYSHSIDGKVEMPKLVKRACPAKLKIWYPVDRTDRRAIVLLTGVHNHPTPPDSKSTKDGRDRYQRAVAAAGVFGATPFKVDRAMSTNGHFEGMRPGEFHASLNSRRQKSDIIRKMKKEKMPYGTGIEAVFHHFIEEQKKPVQDRYIHDFSVADGRPVIVTFVPSLVERIHTAKATLHDCTYKRIAGSDIIEWETVIWLDDIDMRVTIARCYIPGETRQDYRRVLRYLFDSIERVTGKPVLFKAFSGGKGGLRALLVDGCQAQIDAIGDFLKELNDPAVSGISETDPQKLVEWLIKICGVHFDRNVTKLSHKCSAEAIARVRALPNLRTKEELEDFKTYCEKSEEKALRDWYTNKKGMPWFWACINRHFSRMADSDWYTTPDNTNINESAHTLTNLFTGIGLSILEGILSAENFDRQQAATVLSIEKSGVRHNSNNTPAKRMKQGIARSTARHARAVTRAESNSQKKTSRAGKNKILTDGYDSLVSTHDREVSSSQSTLCYATRPGPSQFSGCLPPSAGPSSAPGPSQVHTLPSMDTTYAPARCPSASQLPGSSGEASYFNTYPQASQMFAGVEPGIASAPVARSATSSATATSALLAASYPRYSHMTYNSVSNGQMPWQFEEAYQAYGYLDSTVQSVPAAEGSYAGNVGGWEASRGNDEY